MNATKKNHCPKSDRQNRPSAIFLHLISGLLLMLAGTAMGTLIIQDDGLPYADFTGFGSFAPGTPDYDEPDPADDSYHWFSTGTEEYIWTPGLTGEYVVQTSWAWSNHGSVVDHFFDSDGAGGGAEVDLNITLNQQYAADDQVTQSNPFFGTPQRWSDFYTLGTFTLTASSTFRVTDSSPGALTAGAWAFDEVVVPEPSSLILLTLGLTGILGLRRRRL